MFFFSKFIFLTPTIWAKLRFTSFCASLWHCKMEKFIAWQYMPNGKKIWSFLFLVHHFSNVECPLDSCHRLIRGCRKKISEVIYQLTHKRWVAFVCIHDDDILAVDCILSHLVALRHIQWHCHQVHTNDPQIHLLFGSLRISRVVQMSPSPNDHNL